MAIHVEIKTYIVEIYIVNVTLDSRLELKTTHVVHVTTIELISIETHPIAAIILNMNETNLVSIIANAID